MAVSRDELKEALGNLPVLELVELISELEERMGCICSSTCSSCSSPGCR